TSSTLQRPRPSKWHTRGGDSSDISFPRPSRLATASFTSADGSCDRRPKDPEIVQEDSAYVSAESKRSSAASLNRASLPTTDCREFLPATVQPPVVSPNRVPISSNISSAMGWQSPQPATNSGLNSERSSLPTKTGSAVTPQTPGNGEPSMITPAQLRDLL